MTRLNHKNSYIRVFNDLGILNRQNRIYTYRQFILTLFVVNIQIVDNSTNGQEAYFFFIHDVGHCNYNCILNL